MQQNPKRLLLSAPEAEALNHAYGTNGIITALQLATAPAVQWHQLAIDCRQWSDAVTLLLTCGRAAVEMHLATLLEASVIEQLPPWSGPVGSSHRLLLLVSPEGLSTVQRLAAQGGATVHDLGPENLGSVSGLRELTWNHTTLHMRSRDPRWTYLQMLLPQPELAAMEALRQRWGDSVLWHLEAVRQQGSSLAALPLVRWQARAVSS